MVPNIYIYVCVVYHISSHLQPWFLGTTSSWRHARHIRSHSQDWAWTPRLLYPQRLQRHASMIQQVSACSVINLSPNKSNAKLGVVYEFYYIMNSTNIAFLGVEPPFTAIYTMFNRLGSFRAPSVGKETRGMAKNYPIPLWLVNRYLGIPMDCHNQ